MIGKFVSDLEMNFEISIEMNNLIQVPFQIRRQNPVTEYYSFLSNRINLLYFRIYGALETAS